MVLLSVDGGRGRADELAQLGRAGMGEQLGGRALLPDAALVHEHDLDATLRAKAISCVTSTIVMPWRAMSSMTLSTSPTSSGSSADVTSSNSISAGAIARQRAMATRCCWPPDSRAGQASIFGQSDAAQHVQRQLAALRLADAAVQHGRQRDVALHVQVRKQVELLEHDAHALAELPQPGHGGVDMLAADADLAVVHVLQRVQAAQQRGLASRSGR